MSTLSKDFVNTVIESISLHELISREAGVVFKRTGDQHRGLCPFHKEKSPSFVVFGGRRPSYYCFGAGCGVSGDAISFLRQWKGLSFPEAVDYGCRFANLRMDSQAYEVTSSPRVSETAHPQTLQRWQVPPVPQGVPLPSPGEPVLVNNPRSGMVYWCKPEHVHVYRSVKGEPLLMVLRIAVRDGGKYFHQVAWQAGPAPGYPAIAGCWTQIEFPANFGRPLYGLQDLQLWVDRNVGSLLIVEGEKTRDAAARLVPLEVTGILTLTNLGSTSAIDKIDWYPLVEAMIGKYQRYGPVDILFWQDADAPLEKADGSIVDRQAKFVASWHQSLLTALAGCGHGLNCVKCSRIAPPADVSSGWDLADALDEGWTLQKFLGWKSTNSLPINSDGQSEFTL